MLYTENNQTSRIEVFAKIVHRFQLLTIFDKHCILDISLNSEYAPEMS